MMNNKIHYQAGELWIENIPISKIVKSVSTPCYLYSQATIAENWQAFDRAFANHPHQIFYAVKANSNLAVLNALAQLGSGFDIVSQGELARVLAAGGDPQKIVFSGVGKQAPEIVQALNQNIFCFNVESQAELLLLNQIAEHMNVQAPVSLRVNPDVDPKSHPYISTGLKESKFGIDILQAPQLYLEAAQLSHLAIKGIACHIGSQITSLEPFIDALQRLITLKMALQEHGIAISHLDIGGGVGIRYQQEKPPSPQAYAQALLKICPANLPLLIEPGRAIVGNAGILITQVLFTKQSGNKHFCIVDAAMNDLLRPTLYDAWHDVIAVHQNTHPTLLYDVVGPVCESGDFLAKERHLAVQAGDYLAVMGAGAYGFVMSSNYNTRPRAPEVMIKDTEFKVVRKRETIEQILAEESL